MCVVGENTKCFNVHINWNYYKGAVPAKWVICNHGTVGITETLVHACQVYIVSIELCSSSDPFYNSKLDIIHDSLSMVE